MSCEPSRSAVLLALLAACSADGAGPEPEVPTTFDRRALLAHLADHQLTPTYQRFAADSAALATAVDAHCAALAGAGDAAASLATARAAWTTAIDTWQVAEALLVGPVAADANARRNRIYGWPLLATCSLDQDVAARWADPARYDVATRLDNARSLAAVEYLLVVTDAGHTCALPPAGWDGLGADLPRARCGLAGAIARDVAAQGAALAEAWTGYRDQLVQAGTSASAIASEREAVNMVSDGLFYVDDMVKDMKLGEAAGITLNACGAIDAPCLREVEHRFADHASASIRINLRALRAAFTGTTATDDGPGFDDYLREVGATALAERMTASLDAAIAAADALPDGFVGALTTDRDRVVATHAAVRAFTDDLKSQFLTVLGLDIPDDVAGDND